MFGVLTTASNVDCGHGGRVSTTGQAKLKAAGAPVLLKAGIQGQDVAATCVLKDTTDASGPLTLQCKTVTSVTAGQAMKLKVGGVAVMLNTLAGGTDGMQTKGKPETALKASGVQTKLKAT